MKIIDKIFKQRNMGATYGNFMQVAQQLGLLNQVINLCLLIVTTSSILQTRGYQISVWLLGLIIVVIIIIAAILVFTLGLPSYFTAFNAQFAKHNNPLMQDLEKSIRYEKMIMDKLGIEYDDDDKTL